MKFRVISEKHGLVWQGQSAARAEKVALAVARATKRAVYISQPGSALLARAA